jgi:hypothetical protein
MNDNVGEMPLYIFADYVSDILGEEWSWEYFTLIVNDQGYNLQYTSIHRGFGWGHGYEIGFRYNNDYDHAFGCALMTRNALGIGQEYEADGMREFGKGSGYYTFNFGHAHAHPATK